MSARPVRAEGLEEARLVEVYVEFIHDFGPHVESWQPWQTEQYLAAIEKAHAEFSPQAVAA